jgi:hypothetical protein
VRCEPGSLNPNAACPARTERGRRTDAEPSGALCIDHQSSSLGSGCAPDKGFRYDSSIFPTKNSLYGFYGAPRFPYHPITGTRFVEFPLSRVSIVGLKIPIAGGFYLRTLPYWFVRRAAPASIRKDSRQSSTCTPGNWI